MKRASYRAGVAWIAENDGAGDHDAHNINSVRSMVSVLLLADLFGQPSGLVAEDVVKYRATHGIGKPMPVPEKPGFGDICADDFKYGSDDYYEQTAIDCYGSAIRDNTRGQRIAIGKRVEKNGFEG